MPPAITIRKLWGGVYSLKVLEITWHPWGHTARWGEEWGREGRERVLLGSRVEGLGLPGLLLIGEFKTKEQEYKAGGKKKHEAQIIRYGKQPSPLKQRLGELGRRGGPAGSIM